MIQEFGILAIPGEFLKHGPFMLREGENRLWVDYGRTPHIQAKRLVQMA
jgi:hypothetical protein